MDIWSSLIGALGGLGASLVGSAISSEGASSVNNATMAFNERMQKQSQDYNTKMYERQLQDSRETYEKYQSPEALAMQYEKIGLNPAAVLGNLGSGGSPSVPNAHGSSPLSVGSLINPAAPYADVFPVAVDAVSKLVDSGVKAEKLAPEIQYLMEQINGQQLSNAYQKVTNFLQEKYGDNKLKNEINELITRSYMQYMIGSHNDALISSEKVTKMILENKLGMSDVERANYATYYSEFLRGLRASNALSEESLGIPTLQKQQIKSDTAKNFALGSYYTALAKTEDALRDGRVEMQFLNNDLLTIQKYLSGNELDISTATKDAKILGLIEQFTREKIISEQAAYEARTMYWRMQQAETQSNWEERQQFMKYWSGFFGCVTDAINAYSHLRGVELRRLSSKERNDIQSEFVNEYKQRGIYSRFGLSEGYSPFIDGQFTVPLGY